MTTPRPAERETYRVPARIPLLARLFGRNPLVRSTDRIEALFGLARTLVDRSRHAGWQRDFDRMVGV
jgi:hypothetical protein